VSNLELIGSQLMRAISFSPDITNSTSFVCGILSNQYMSGKTQVPLGKDGAVLIESTLSVVF